MFKNLKILNKMFFHILLIFILLKQILPVFLEPLDSEIFDPVDLEFAKDISTLILESTLKSKCDGSVFVSANPQCDYYLGHALASSLVDWAPPVLLIKFTKFDTISEKRKTGWGKYLSRHRRSCSLVFVCDLELAMNNFINETLFSNLTEVLDSSSTFDQKTNLEIGHLKLPNFFTALDQIIYFSELLDENYKSHPLPSSCNHERTRDVEQALLKHSGVLIAVRANISVGKIEETRMQVCSSCIFCDPDPGQQYNLIGEWRRNKTNFGKFMGMFQNFMQHPFEGVHFRIGYFDYYPHFACHKTRNENINSFNIKCLGTEWEIITQLSKALNFKFNLINVGRNEDEEKGNEFGEFYLTNFTKMISSLRDDLIDMCVGGITITSDRNAMIDFTQVFEIEPIVFIVQKPKSIFVLGIWLSFQPHVWPIILLLVAIMSFLFQSITNDNHPFSCCHKTSKKKLSLSILIDEAMKEAKRKPLLVRMFIALELTLQPMLGQPLNQSQISQPRRFKILLILWWFSCLIITTLYSTSLITSLINPVLTKEAESLSELIASGYRFKIGGRHVAVYDLINSSTSIENQDEDFIQTVRNFVPEEGVIKLLQQIKSRLITSSTEFVNPNQIAYIIEESGIGNNNNLQFENMIIMKEKLYITGYSLALKPQSHFKRKFDTALGRLNGGGLIEQWTSSFINKGKVLERKFRLRERLGQINLNLKIMQGAFIFLIFGLTCSSIIFLLEHWNKRYTFKLFTRHQIMSVSAICLGQMGNFYRNHVADKSQEKRRRKQQERFRQVVENVVKLRHEQQQLAFIK